MKFVVEPPEPTAVVFLRQIDGAVQVCVENGNTQQVIAMVCADGGLYLPHLNEARAEALGLRRDPNTRSIAIAAHTADAES